MATVVEHTQSPSGGGMGFLLGAILLIVFAVLFMVYGLPYMSNAMQGPQVNIPSKIDVNVQNPK